MSWYTIDHACGHTEQHRITSGNRRSRDWRAEKMREHDCDECCTKARRADLDARNAAAAAEAADNGYPELTGTPGQVAWATTIRSNALGRLAAFGEVLDESDEDEESRAAYRDLVAEIRAIYLAATGAAAWLDHRDGIADPVRMAGNLAPEQRERLCNAQRRVLHLSGVLLRAAHRFDTGRLES
ncbi:hypothetical protein [Nocardia carnea]|uniref:hypothetical protein n=1 Tax=Nocardia carnea TaxID=37328 RepID=UPI00245815B9|nr:hypothetical protein [Nocardia carnea]